MREDPNTALFWNIVERFYRSCRIFMRQHDRYEALVARHVEEKGIPRDRIRLEPEQLSELLNFKVLERLRDSFLLPLKNTCHAFFRTYDTTDFLDRLVSDIFHEVSILKEEHYNVRTYSPDRDQERDREELEAILDEVHDMFPHRVHRLHHLFERARGRIEQLLATYCKNTVLIRSLFLHRDEFVAEAYPDGLNHFYRLLYGENEIFEGYVAVGDSFYKSGFHREAQDCYQAGEDYLQGIPPQRKRRLHPGWKAAREHFRRSLRACQKRLALAEEV